MSRYNNTTTQTTLQAALDHAEAGHPVLPWRMVKGRKVPHIKDWPNEASTVPERIRKWWKRWPDAQVGIVTGKRSGIDVLDLDQKDGKDGMAALRDAGHDVDSPVIIKTPTGGLHYWYEHVPGHGGTQNLDGMEGVDVRADGGWAGVPGSDGYSYQTGDLDLWTALLHVGCLPAWPLPVQPRKPSSGSTAEPSGLPFHVLRDALLKLSIEERERHFGSDGEWFKVGRVIYDETGGSEEGRALWHEFSEGWGGYDYADAESKWHREDYGGERASVWTILRPAKASGWTHPDLEAWEIADDFDDPEIATLVGEPEHDWGTPMMRGNTPLSNQNNARHYLGKSRDSILPRLRHNEMTHRDEWVRGEVSDAALSTARIGLERAGMGTVAKELVTSAVRSVALARAYHPVRDWMTCQNDDGRGLLDSWLVRYFGADDSTYTRAVGRMFAIQMVARVMEPGCKADYMPVLHGAQGLGKSTTCRALAGGYFSDSMPPVRGDAIRAMDHLRGLWLVEVAEMASMREAAQEELKSFLSRQVDRFRASYGRVDEAYARQCVFIGTTNKDSFLRDETGGRRFWPIACNRPCDPEGLARDRGQLFAEALAAYRAGEQWWPEREFEREHLAPMQEAAFGADPWEEEIREYLNKIDTDFDGTGKARRETTVREIMDLMNLPAIQRTRAMEMRLAGILKDRLGWVRVKNGKGNMVWRCQPVHLELVG
ncbi:MAG: VapE domain-containing protein [Sulfitobacter sp.]|uniref:VapE domain-containing protein n=1 Tax=Sulfitobacter sp. TaxID=1903071 RepID=UPI003298AC08